jgi:hypothetical protein
MSNKKMIHVFNEMVVKAGRDVDTAELHFINGGVSATFFCAQQAHHAAHAINSHDRLVEENKQQRESLDAFKELVKAQTKMLHDLNEENKRLSESE